VALTTRLRRNGVLKRMRLGRASFAIGAGKRVTIKLSLPRSAGALLRHRLRINGRAEIKASDASAQTRRATPRVTIVRHTS
jgi:hypothetical protein